MRDVTYTQEQVDALKVEWVKTELEPLKAQVTELEKFKPNEKSDAEKQLEQKANDLWQKEVTLTLKEHDLDAFAEFITAADTESLKCKIESLKVILAQNGLINSFKPSSHKTTDKYSLAESKKDTTGMIATKLSALFKN